MRIVRLKHRREFLFAASHGQSMATKGLVLQAVPSPEAEGHIRVGFTVTKKVGGAVIRNRVKRRLRALAEAVLGTYAKPGYDYVLIGRYHALERPFPDLAKDLKYALHQTGTYQKPTHQSE